MDCKRLINSMRYNNRVPPEDIAEAADAIETLLEERDAAIRMLVGECRSCKHNTGCHNIGKCASCVYENAKGGSEPEKRTNCWEWNGPQKEGCKDEQA